MKPTTRRPGPTWIFAVLGLLLCIARTGAAEVPASPVPAASDRLDQAFAALDAGDWPSALRLFSQLSHEFPGEPELFYYLGVAAASNGDDHAAALAFASAASLDPQLDWVQADLGISLFRLGEFELAEEHLLEALLQGPEDAGVLLHLGLIDLEYGNTARGRNLLEESAALEPEMAALTFYQAAQLELDRDNVDAALVLLERSVEAPGPEEWRDASAQLLAELAESQGLLSRVHLSGAVGIEHDDNLTVSQTSLSTGIGDIAATFDAGIEIEVLREEPVGLTVGYDFFQSLHQDLEQFDLQVNEPHVEIYGFLGKVQSALAYAYRRESYHGRNYLESHIIDLEFTLCGRWNSCALVGGEFERLRFDAIPGRDANRYTLLIGEQTFFLQGLLAVSLRWQPQWQDATGNFFDYDAQIVSAGTTIFLDGIRNGLVAGLSYEFESRDYRNEIRSLGFARRDKQHVIWAGARIPLFGPTQASFDYVRVISRTNIPDLDYDENIISFKLWAWH